MLEVPTKVISPDTQDMAKTQHKGQYDKSLRTWEKYIA